MEYTIGQLAALSGVSPRTLRYYDSIGLVKPARVTHAGYRVYGTREVDQLQQVLMYRALGMPLEMIARLVHEPGVDRLSALRGQRARLETRRRELCRLIETIDRTIEHETGGVTMADSEKFECFKQEKLEENQRLYGAELRARYGEDAVEAQNRHFAALSEDVYREMEALEQEILDGLAAAVRAGEQPSGGEGRRLLGLHRRWLGFAMPDCTGATQRGLCEMYVCDPRFAAYYDREVPGCAQFLRDAAAALLP